MTHCDTQAPRRAAEAGASLGWKAGRMGAISKALRDEGRHA